MPKRVCFVISPTGPNRAAPMKKRRDYVIENYINPALEKADYEPLRVDRVGRDIIQGTTTALENAPMAVAYMGPIPGSGSSSKDGAPCWDANVMIEIGYRLASRLPLILLCDQDADGARPDLPLTLQTERVIELPCPDPDNPKWDNDAKNIVNALVSQFDQQEQEGRILVSSHAIAAINAANISGRSVDNLLYTAASQPADNLFRWDQQAGRLVGRTMDQFLDGLKKRMHAYQWNAFARDQDIARRTLVARVPIVFETHENDDYNRRAFLPIVVQNYQPPEKGLNWANLRVLYLDVTTATEVVRGEGEPYYRCGLDLGSNNRLPPLTQHKGIRIFLSYRSENRTYVERLYKQLVAMGSCVDPFIDTSIKKGDNWLQALRDVITDSELCFVFLDNQDMGPGQAAEVEQIQRRRFTAGGRNYPVVPVLLRSPGRQPELPDFLGDLQWVKFDELADNDAMLQQILFDRFSERVPRDWNRGPRVPSPIPSPPPIPPIPIPVPPIIPMPLPPDEGQV
jgi:TIR domain